MQKRRRLIIFCTTFALTCAWFNRAADGQERELIEVLQSNVPAAEKAITCKRLAVCGTGAAVPALAPLLSDPELASWARIALEVIPDPAAEAALRDALSSLDGRLLIGVINSIGIRRDAAAVQGLAQRLNDTDPQIASAAAIALGKIADTRAMQLLRASLATAPGEVRSAVAQGCILCAENLRRQINADEAVALYDAVRQADVSSQRLREATRGAILARGAYGIPLLVEQLRSPDKQAFWMGLSTARELSGSEVTAALMAELGRATPDHQALLIHVLADRGDATALPVVLQTARRGATKARIAALAAVSRLGDRACIPDLLEIATEDDAAITAAAKDTLAALPGDGVNRDLVARLEQAEGKTWLVLIELAGRRRLAATMSELRRAADDGDAAVRAAALTALGAIVDMRQLDILLHRVVDPPHPEDAPVARLALHAACIRLPDREVCAEQLITTMEQAPLSAQVSILRILSAMGGTRALQAVGSAAQGSQPELRDIGTQLLGEWMSVDAAPVLLDLARSAEGAKYRVRALRGYIRLARQFSMPADERAAMCRAALQIAHRDAERKLVLEVLKRYPSIDMLEVAVKAAELPSLKDDAMATIFAIAGKLGPSAEVQQLLDQLGQQP